MDNDDLPIGRILTRREAVELLGVASAGLLVGCRPAEGHAAQVAANSIAQASANGMLSAGNFSAANLACIVRPEATEGPYFVDKQLDRSDVRVEPATGTASAGVPLTVAFAVSSVDGASCKPLPGAIVDVWMCDAAGVYSGVNDVGGSNTVGQKFLRGFQTTDKNGMARFLSIYPGWYRGRTVHYHFKIRTTGADRKAYEFTSQLFFDDAISDLILANAPYKRSTERDTRNSNDMFLRSVGDQLMLNLEKGRDGYSGTFNIGLDLANANVGRSDSGGGRGGRGRGGPLSDGRGRGRGDVIPD